MTGYKEVIPRELIAPLLPACRQATKNPVFRFLFLILTSVMQRPDSLAHVYNKTAEVRTILG